MTHPSRYELDQWVAGEKVGGIETHINGCDMCRTYVSCREEEQQVLMAHQSADSFIRHLQHRTEKRRISDRFGWRLNWQMGLAAAAAAAAVAAVLWVTGPNTATPSVAVSTDSEETLRWMGGRFATQIFVKRGDRVFVPNDDAIRAGDKVQFEITPKTGEIGYAAVVASDPHGATVVLPSGSSTAHKISRKTLLPGSVDLDNDAAGTTLCLVVRTAPFSLSMIDTEIQKRHTDKKTLSSLPGSRYCVQVSK